MSHTLKKQYKVFLLLFIIIFVGCQNSSEIIFHNVNGFDEDVNLSIKKFLQDTKNYQGRKIAVFDGDGTVLGQTPHYLADECLYSFANDHPDRKPEVLNKLKSQSNVSLEYVQNRIHFMSGDSLSFWRREGKRIFKKHYSDKIYKPMKDFILMLQKNNFEVWIVTASPEAMYQEFLSNELNIPITHVVGVKSVISNGIITDEIIPPVPQDHGKMEAIESFVQGVPLLVAGNSRGDKEMIEYSSKLKMIVNPDEHIAPDQTESISDYAIRDGWMIVRINDEPHENFPAVSSKQYGIRLNKTKTFKPSQSNSKRDN